MANNCLLTQIKGSVDNPYILAVDEFSFIPKSDGTTKFKIGWNNIASHVELVNSNVNGSTSIDITAGETPTEKTVTVTGNNPLVKLSERQKVDYIDIVNTENLYIEQFNYVKVPIRKFSLGICNAYGDISRLIGNLGKTSYSGISTDEEINFGNNPDLVGDLSNIGGTKTNPRYFRNFKLYSSDKVYGNANGLGYTAVCLLDVAFPNATPAITFDIVEFVKKARTLNASKSSTSRGVIFSRLAQITTTVGGVSTYSFPTNTTIKWTPTTITFTTTTGDVTIENSDVEQ